MFQYWFYLEDDKMWYNHLTKKLIPEDCVDMLDVKRKAKIANYPEFTLDTPNPIPYKYRNPLTHRCSKCQIKDLRIDDRISYILKWHAKRELKDLMSNAGPIKCRENERPISMEDIDPLIKELFGQYLDKNKSRYDIDDWFNEEYVGYVDGLRYRIWNARLFDEEFELIDIYHMPGDNEHGCVYLKTKK